MWNVISERNEGRVNCRVRFAGLLVFFVLQPFLTATAFPLVDFAVFQLPSA
jgi:hypothetical protein